jgi:hypothetical protein
MPEQEPTPDPAERSARTESTIMVLLIAEDEQRPWSTEELVLEIGRPMDVTDAITSLHAAGLVHRTTDGFVFPTRAAVRMEQVSL